MSDHDLWDHDHRLDASYEQLIWLRQELLSLYHSRNARGDDTSMVKWWLAKIDQEVM